MKFLDTFLGIGGFRLGDETPDGIKYKKQLIGGMKNDYRGRHTEVRNGIRNT